MPASLPLAGQAGMQQRSGSSVAGGGLVTLNGGTGWL